MSEIVVSTDILDGVRLLETEFKRNAINGTGGRRLPWDQRATLVARIAQEIEADRAEITSLRSQLDEARRKAIEECAQIAERSGKWNEEGDFSPRPFADCIASEIRALIDGDGK